MRVGNIETWIQARAAVRRGKGMAPRHARGGRHAAAPRGFALYLMRKLGLSSHGWTADGVDRAARIGAL